MRHSLTLCLLLAAGAIAAGSAFAASSYILNTADPNAVAACTAQGGTVQTDANRRKVCVIQQACAPATLPYVVNTNDPNAAQTCAAACGTIALNASGQQVCVANNAMREPSNNK